MCGIAGWVHYQKDLRPCKDIVRKMTDTLTHRGPDEYGYYDSPHALFGHRRLVVIDPEGGRQPMTRSIGPYTYTIVYNGELYNTDDIRKQLEELGYAFLSHSDTEVVLMAYIAWGEGCMKYLNGIYAFGVWEDRSKSLFLARDRLGVKPLFYAYIDGALIFGSEIKALLAFPDLEPIVDEGGLLELFSLGPSRVPGSGVFKNISELKPAEYIIHTPKTSLKKVYWKPTTREHEDNEEATIEHMSYLVEDAITRQLVSDVPLCTFLSGGLDSSGISSIASQYLKQSNKQLITYSIDYEDNNRYFEASEFQPSNDNLWVGEVSHYVGSCHEQVVLGMEELAEGLRDAVYAYDLPGMADIDSSLMLFCNKVKEKHTVALSGECADEIFGGYPWYQKQEEVYYDGFPWNKHVSERKAFLSPRLAKLQLEDYAYARYMDSINEIEDIGHMSAFEGRIKKLTYINLKWFMLTLLTRKDRMSMYKSLEVRVPYADHRIVEYAWNVPWSLKNYGNIEKGLLRKCLEPYLPHRVVYRKKSPYPKTHNPIYKDMVKTMLLDILDHKSSPIHQLIHTKQVRELLKNDKKLFITPWFGQLMKEPQFIAYLVQLNIWLETYKVHIDF